MSADRRRRRRGLHYASGARSLTGRIIAALAVLATASFLSSCGGSPDNHAHSTLADDKPVITGEPGGYNNVDVAFAKSINALEDQGSMCRT